MFDEQKANEPIEFINLLNHTGDFFGQPFNLLDWQKEVLSNVYGTLKENGYRQYKYAYLEIPKKNGKTELTAAVAIYHLVCDAPGGQIYCCAAEREQAGLVYLAAKQMIEQDEELEKILNVVDSQKKIINRNTGTFLKVLSAEAYSKHGVNPTVIIFDELHAQPKRDLWDFMTFGSGAARKERLVWVITTAGDDPDRKSIGWEKHNEAVKILNGEINDPTWYVKIYGALQDDDIFDEKVWFECNPSLGVSIDIDNVRDEAREAQKNQAAEKLFRWLRLNQWVQLKRIGWLPVTLWDDTKGNWKRKELIKKRCYVGIDLSSKIDLTALVPLFPPQKNISEWRYFIEAFLPEDNISERVKRDNVSYDIWFKNGYLNNTPGDVIDLKTIKNHIETIEEIYDVQYYCGDEWHLETLKQILDTPIQKKFIVIPQTMAGQTIGMRELEILFRKKQITHEDNPLDRWSFSNVVVATDGNENIKPMKNKSIERIDPTVGLINAMAGAIKLENKTKSIYEERGMRIL